MMVPERKKDWRSSLEKRRLMQSNYIGEFLWNNNFLRTNRVPFPWTTLAETLKGSKAGAYQGYPVVPYSPRPSPDFGETKRLLLG